MKITDLLTEETIVLEAKARTKEEIIDELAQTLEQAGVLHDLKAFKEAVLLREAQSTTGIGDGIAIPHAKTSAVARPAVAFGRSNLGIDYDALDGKPSHLFFMIAAPDGADHTHLEALARLSSMLMDAAFRSRVESASTKEELLSVIKEKEAAEEIEPETAPASAKKNSSGYSLSNRNCPYVYGG